MPGYPIKLDGPENSKTIHCIMYLWYTARQQGLLGRKGRKTEKPSSVYLELTDHLQTPYFMTQFI